jgi:hypothetical protein
MLPGMKTGWPTPRKSTGISSDPAGKARVAPFRCTRTSRPPWRSTFATLWDVVDLAGPGGDFGSEHLLDGGPDGVGDRVSVGEGEVRGRSHRGEIPASLGRGGRGAGELAVRKTDAVALLDGIHRPDVIRADLVPEPAGARVDQDSGLPLAEAEGVGRDRVEDAGNALKLDEVVPAAGGAQLSRSALVRVTRDSRRIGSGQAPPRFGAFEIVLPADATGDERPRPVAQDRIEVARRGRFPEPASHTGRDRA